MSYTYRQMSCICVISLLFLCKNILGNIVWEICPFAFGIPCITCLAFIFNSTIRSVWRGIVLIQRRYPDYCLKCVYGKVFYTITSLYLKGFLLNFKYKFLITPTSCVITLACYWHLTPLLEQCTNQCISLHYHVWYTGIAILIDTRINLLLYNLATFSVKILCLSKT
jgi:hypothetical protein